MSVAPETVVFKSVGPCEIKADIYRAPDSGRRPTIVWIHGGALIVGRRSGLQARHLEAYLNAGFHVTAIDYRLAPETKLPQIIADLTDAFAWIRNDGAARFDLDPERIGVVGHSAGGYLTLMAGCTVSPRPRALVSFYGYGDVIGSWYSEPDSFYRQQPLVPEAEAMSVVGGAETCDGRPERGRYYLYCRQNGIWPRMVGGRDPQAEPEWFHPYCPERNVAADYPPTLLLHGTEDTDVPYELSVRMEAALSRAGVEHELVTIRGGGHGFEGRMDEAEFVPLFDRVLEFFRRHLR